MLKIKQSKIEEQTSELTKIKAEFGNISLADKYKSELIGEQSYKIARLQESNKETTSELQKYKDTISNYSTEIKNLKTNSKIHYNLRKS